MLSFLTHTLFQSGLLRLQLLLHLLNALELDGLVWVEARKHAVDALGLLRGDTLPRLQKLAQLHHLALHELKLAYFTAILQNFSSILHDVQLINSINACCQI